MLLLVAVLMFLAGVAVGGWVAARRMHVLVARLTPEQRMRFARKVNAAAK